jgi:hypothetical protein
MKGVTGSPAPISDQGLFWAISWIEFVIFSTLKSSMICSVSAFFLSLGGLLSLPSSHFIRSTV